MSKQYSYRDKEVYLVHTDEDSKYALITYDNTQLTGIFKVDMSELKPIKS
jgi:hypothetical protein